MVNMGDMGEIVDMGGIGDRGDVGDMDDMDEMRALRSLQIWKIRRKYRQTDTQFLENLEIICTYGFKCLGKIMAYLMS